MLPYRSDLFRNGHHLKDKPRAKMLLLLMWTTSIIEIKNCC
jgi:hypothetical protein